jgi:hypothetical protein
MKRSLETPRAIIKKEAPEVNTPEKNLLQRAVKIRAAGPIST